MSAFRPVYVMTEEGVPQEHLNAVLEAIDLVLKAAQVYGRVEVKNFGLWRESIWRHGKTLAKWNSIDWYIAEARKASRNTKQLHGGHLMKLLYNEPWQKEAPHYDVVVIRHDMYDDDCRFCIGLAIQGTGTVVSTFRFGGLDDEMQRQCIITETMHEVGHVFGLVPESRTDNVERSLGLHCRNRCIMRQGLAVPKDWIAYTKDRLAGHGFCARCEADLRQFFAQ